MKNINSFSQTVKEEIVGNNYVDERLHAILSAFVRINGQLQIRNKIAYVELNISNAKITRFIYSSIIKIFGCSPSISYLKRSNLKKSTYYRIRIENKSFLEKLYVNFLENKINSYFKKNSERFNGYLTGAFLASGMVNSPRSSNYHLEIAFHNQNSAKWFCNFLNNAHVYDFNMRVVPRRDLFISYIKRSDQISYFLGLIGATNSCLYFENIRVDRDFANELNRLKNLDFANYQKTTASSQIDCKIISSYIKKYGSKNFGSEKLNLLAELRLQNPDISYEELATMMSKKLNTEVTKSNVNHLIRKLRSMR